jgi:hypothetical protein
MSNWLSAFGIVFLVVALSLLGMLLVRRNVTLATLESHNEVAGFVYAVVGVIYAVLATFMVYAVYVDYQAAENQVSKEAASLGDLYRLSSNLQEPTRSASRQILREYAQVMVEKEFPAMEKGDFHGEGKIHHDKLWDLFYQYRPQNELDKLWFDKSLSTFIEFADARRNRMVSAKQALPSFMWLVLYVGGVITIAYSYFFGTKNAWAQALIVIFLSVTVTLVILLIYALDLPFTGIIPISPEPFRLFLKYFS